MSKKRKIVLRHHRSPGDIVTMTALVRDIVLAHGDTIALGVQTRADDIWRHNPYIDPELGRGNRRDVTYVSADYGRGIRDQAYRPVHFLAYWHEDFRRQTNIAVPLTQPYPDLHLSPTERDIPLVEGRYWVVVAGGKSDYPIKVWRAAAMQEVVTALGDRGLGVVQIGSNDLGHWHPEMRGANVIDYRGRSNLRDMMRLIHHADGVICGVTCAMHMAAALHRPCVVVAGGREAWWWEAYVRENAGLAPVQTQLRVSHRYLHTIGLLDCCRQHGCWRNKVVRVNDDKSLCALPVLHADQPVPKCLDMISPQHVLEAVMQYYEDKTLPPIQLSDEAAAELPAVAPVPAAATSAAGSAPTRVRASVPIKLPEGMSLADVLKRAKFRVNSKATPEGRGALSARPTATQPQPAVAVASAPGDQGLDHIDVGGKFTICVLLYGGDEFHALHRRCLTAILATVPRDRMDLRVGSNALGAQSTKLVDSYVGSGDVTKHYRHETNAYKYPVMREMFFDPTHPITTKWVVWFDDDSIADRTPAWLNLLAQQIVQFHRRENAHMFGAPFVWTLQPGQREWYESRPWHRKRPWRTHAGTPSPNGNKILFATGGFWAITHEAIVGADVPDAALAHNGGDITIGEQLYQAGYGLKAWNTKKQFVHTSSVPRRGATTPMPGTRPQ